mgnify:CR=1 FL=1
MNEDNRKCYAGEQLNTSKGMNKVGIKLEI